MKTVFLLPTQWGGAPKGRRGADVVLVTETTSVPHPAFGHLPRKRGREDKSRRTTP